MTDRRLPPHDELLELSKTMTNIELSRKYGVRSDYISALLIRLWREAGCGRPNLKRKLPPDRELIDLSREMSNPEIARHCNVSVSAVTQGLRKARERTGLYFVRATDPSQYIPARGELDDALTRWGVEGCAEEYEVTIGRVKAWMRALNI